MSDNNNSVSLYGGQYHISKNPSDAYRVSEGTVLVFIVPLKSWGEGRRSFIYEAGKGEIIPSFCHKDADAVNWRFCFTALEKAELEIIESGSTKLLKDRFASKIELPNYDIEGYNSGLVEKYKANILKEDILIRRTLHSKTATYSGIMSLIASAFKKNKIVADLDRTGDILYDSVAFLCKKLSIEPAGYERVREACGDTFGLADIARVSYISYRKITLSSGWEKRDNGAFLVYNSENVPLVCLQKGSNSHILVDLRDNSVVPVTASVAASLSPEAYMIYRPFPAKKLTTQDIVRFCVKTVRKSDFILLVVLTVIGAAIGLIIPTISQKLYDDFIPIGASDVLKGLILVMSSFMLANVMISIVKNLADFRIVSGMNYSVCSAMLERIFRMPESFFRDYESSDLAHRVMGFGGLVSTAASALLTSAVLLIFSTIYFARMVFYDRSLAAVGLLMTVLYSIAYYCINLVALK
ncbi:MAG: hypothetical protein IKH65_05460, partial [Clostridia bacterium]|nr:hypothetical protein [Clostridia bacterium]